MDGISVSVPTLREMDGAAEAIWDQLQGAVAAFKADHAQLGSEISASLGNLVSDLDSALVGADFSSGDYNPPTYAYAENASMEAAGKSRTQPPTWPTSHLSLADSPTTRPTARTRLQTT